MKDLDSRSDRLAPGSTSEEIEMTNIRFETLLFKVESGIASIALNRPAKLNAVSGPMINELHQCLDLVATDDAIRAVVLSGEGRAFSAGFDLESDPEAQNDPEFWDEELRRDFDIIMKFWDCPKPTIAAVHGYCLGSALEITLACDVTISTDDCFFGEPEVKHGDGIICLILPWIIGVKAAKEMLLTGDDRVSAERALALGIINKIVTKDDLTKEALDLAKRIAANDRLAVMLTKKAIHRGFEIMGMREALLEAMETDIVITNTETPESRAFSKVSREQGVKAALAWRAKSLSIDQKPL
ncbi:MAG: enoyl-CoA hydratase/isomerase family protein [bacterium]